MATHERKRALRRASIECRDIVAILLFVGIGLLLFLPMFSRRQPTSKRAICAHNLRGIGQGLHIYAEDNGGSFPIHYFSPAAEQPGDPE